MITVDARGLSCPEPVMLAMDAMKEAKGGCVKVLVLEPHQRKNIEDLAKHEKREFMTVDKGDYFEVTIE